jgi:hypothetical protein
MSMRSLRKFSGPKDDAMPLDESSSFAPLGRSWTARPGGAAHFENRQTTHD